MHCDSNEHETQTCSIVKMMHLAQVGVQSSKKCDFYCDPALLCVK